MKRRESQNERKKALTLFFIVILNGCVTTHNPGNPEYAWLNGTWEGPSTGGVPFRLDLSVLNGNEVTGPVAWYRRHAAFGTSWRNDGHAWGKIEGVTLNLAVRWHGSGNITHYRFTYHPEDQSLRSGGTYLTKPRPDSRYFE